MKNLNLNLIKFAVSKEHSASLMECKQINVYLFVNFEDVLAVKYRLIDSSNIKIMRKEKN